MLVLYAWQMQFTVKELYALSSETKAGSVAAVSWELKVFMEQSSDAASLFRLLALPDDVCKEVIKV